MCIEYIVLCATEMFSTKNPVAMPGSKNGENT